MIDHLGVQRFTGGDDLAQALWLWGCEPVWEEASGRVVDFKILPASLLGRPRVDITLRISGLFRDAFGDTVRLLAAIPKKLAQLEEPAELNPIRAAFLRDSARLSAGGVSPEAAARTAGLRVPMSGPQDRRVENRLAGADANPYLASAASLACGYLGMVQGLTPTEPLSGSAHDMPFSLPRSLDEAIRLLRECEPLIEILGESFVSAFTIVKEAEYEVFLQVISSWEREHLLLNV
jgi:hypothetical protein